MACLAGGPATFRGRVAQLDEADRRIVLEDGREFFYFDLQTTPARGTDYDEVDEGIDVEIEGFGIADEQGGFAWTVGPMTVPDPIVTSGPTIE